MKSTYEKAPFVNIEGYKGHTVSGYQEICKKIQSRIKLEAHNKTIISIECYPGVRIDEIVDGFKCYMSIDHIIYSDNYAKSGEEITQMIQYHLRGMGRFLQKTYAKSLFKEN